MPTAIVTGATGILGREIVRELSSKPEEWSKIYALSRSKKEDFTQNVIQSHLYLCATPEEMASELQGIEADYVFFAAYLEQDTEAKASKVNGDMLDAFLKALVLNNSASKIKRIILVCGAKQYGVQHGRVKIPMQETDPWLPEDEPFAPNFYYRQQRILHAFCAAHPSISWVVTYPNEVIGFAQGNFMNFGTAVAIYAAVQRELGSNELVFPGAEDFYTRITMFSDARLHGQFCRWAALAPDAGNLSFNVVNGDAASWQDLWPRVARYFGLHVPADQFTRPAPTASERKLAARTPFSLSAEAIGVATSSVSGEQKQDQSYIRQRVDLVEWSRSSAVQEAWRRLAAREGLHGNALDRASWAFAGFAWGRDYDVVLSMSRACQLGWTGYADSWDGFETVFRGLADAKVIPKQR
ncbi:nad dependent epimerase dehydratase family protein [Colletotrichum camelliae]|nr:nad dependent epimerase dehydratase family protein [Colletotrichum camelliae]